MTDHPVLFPLYLLAVRRGWTIADIARLSGKRERTVRRHFTGERRATHDEILDYCEVFGIRDAVVQAIHRAILGEPDNP